jgi:hypothetical protein
LGDFHPTDRPPHPAFFSWHVHGVLSPEDAVFRAGAQWIIWPERALSGD